MAEPIERGRTSVWEYVSPLAVVDRPLTAYTSPFASVIYGPYSAMAAGRGITFPGVFPVFSNIRGVSKAALGAKNYFNRSVAKLPGFINDTTVGRFGVSGTRALLFGGSLGGTVTRDARLLAAAGNTFDFLTGTSFNRFAEHRLRRAAATVLPTKTAVGGGATLLQHASPAALARVPGRLTIGTVAKAGFIRLGTTIGGLMNAAAVIQIAAFGAEAAYKGIQSVSEMIDRSTERIHSLELGGELGRNFLTRQAATERQRALNAIQASHLSGRRMMGNEAELLHK